MKRRAWFVVASIVAASTVKNSIALSASSRMDHDGRIRSRAHPNSLGLAYVTRPETRLLTIQDNRKRKSRLSSSSSAAHQTVSETEIVVEASPPQQTEEHTNTEEVLQVGLREEEEAVPSEWSHALRRFYLGEIGPPLVVLSICAFAYARFKLSCVFAVTDTLVFASSVIFWWIQEYFFHRVLLHAPFGWIGNSIHQKHHDKTYFHVSVDPPALLLGWLFAAHFMLKSVLPWNLCLSATIGYASAGLFYEWSHYIVHTKVKPSRVSSSTNLVLATLSNYYSSMRNNHIRHHRINGAYWFAFSIPAMDDTFNTNPRVEEVSRSLSQKPRIDK